MEIYIYFLSTDLINELEKDIAKFGNTDVWTYWKLIENIQEI